MRRRHTQDGHVALAQVALLVALAVLVGVATLDVTALLRAARVAGGAADGAALAAASAAVPPRRPPRPAAEGVARANGATLVRCVCTGPRVDVAVTLPVTTRLLHLLGVEQVRATATARLVPDAAGTRAPVRGPPSAPEPRSGSLVGSGGGDAVVVALAARHDARRPRTTARPTGWGQPRSP